MGPRNVFNDTDGNEGLGIATRCIIQRGGGEFLKLMP